MSIKSNIGIGDYDKVKRFADKFEGTITTDGSDYIVSIDTNRLMYYIVLIGHRLPCKVKLINKSDNGSNINLMNFNNSNIKLILPCRSIIHDYSIKYSYCDITDIKEFDSKSLKTPNYCDCIIHINKEDIESISKERLEELKTNNKVIVDL